MLLLEFVGTLLGYYILDYPYVFQQTGTKFRSGETIEPGIHNTGRQEFVDKAGIHDPGAALKVLR